MWKALNEFNKIIAQHLQYAWEEFAVFTQNHHFKIAQNYTSETSHGKENFVV